MKRVVLCLLSIVCFAATDVLAAPITYKFEGEILHVHNHIGGGLPLLEDLPLLSFTIAGTFDYDPAGIADTDPSGTQGAYAGAITNLHFDLGEHFSTSSATLLTNPSGTVLLADLGPYPGFESTTLEIVFDWIGAGPGDEAPDQLPGLSDLVPQDPGAGEVQFLLYGTVTEDGETFLAESHVHYVLTEFAQASEVPEPGVLALLALAALSCGIGRRTKM
jgi:hypothetical protein